MGSFAQDVSSDAYGGSFGLNDPIGAKCLCLQSVGKEFAIFAIFEYGSGIVDGAPMGIFCPVFVVGNPFLQAGPLSQIHHAGSGILFLLSTDETQPRLCGHRSGSGGILHRILPARILQYNDKQKNGGDQFRTNTAGRFPTTRQGRNMVYLVLPDASRARMDLPWKRERSPTPESESRWLLPVSTE